MKTSIATVSLPGTLRDKLTAIAAAGFDGIEIFEQDFIAATGSPRDIGEMIRDHGLDITLFQPFRDFEGLTGRARARALDRARAKFDTMNELGTDLILVCSSCHPDALGGIDRAAEDFAELGEIARARGIRVGYEALAWGRHVDDHRDAWEVVRRADHPNVGLILDSFHTLARGIDADTIRRIPGDRIFFVQLADAPAIEMDLLYRSRHFRSMPGEGDLPVTDFMRAVMATGYAGPVSLEIFNDKFRSGRSRTVAQDGYRSLLALMDDVAREEPGTSPPVPDLPPRVAARGVSFVEFATRGEEAAALAGRLDSLGFVHVARHITKDVDLWQQGDIRIVLNRETSGFAATAWATHGTTVCDIGLSVPDAEAARRRATALGTAPFVQPVGDGERAIPAVRGVGGSVLHFMDGDSAAVWSEEFTATGAAPLSHLTAIDHIAETVDDGELLSRALFYTTLFDLRKTGIVDVIDPDGLVHSRALQAPDGGLRLTLNGAESHRTLAGRFLASSFGGTVQHVAFRTNDIFAAAEALSARGLTALPMTQNYYRDLAARFDLPAAELDRMAASNILYDEDATGRFYQLYASPLPGGFFFEIVQRTGSYDGYGAPNAPYRIAAQKRALRDAAVPLA